MGKIWYSRKERAMTDSERQEMDDFMQMGARADLTAEQERAADVDTLIRHNFRRVSHIAQGYVGQGVPLGDLLRAGLESVWKSAEKYDGSVRFGTYATPAIHRACQRAVHDEGSSIRLPVHLLDGSTDKKHAAREGVYMNKQSESSIRNTQRAAQQMREITSLDAPIISAGENQDNDDPLSWIVGDDSSAEDVAIAIIDARAHGEMFTRAMAVLSERERQVITLYYGIGCEPMVLREIEPIMGISRTRIGQIKDAALAKMRKELHDDEL